MLLLVLQGEGELLCISGPAVWVFIAQTTPKEHGWKRFFTASPSSSSGLSARACSILFWALTFGDRLCGWAANHFLTAGQHHIHDRGR
jgi:hypothetical protein